MKVLFLTYHWLNNSHHSKYGGYQQIIFSAAKHFKVTLITWGSTNSEYNDEYGIKVITVKGKKGDFLLKRFQISFLARKIYTNYDVVHALYSDCTFFLPKGSYIATFHVLPSVVLYKSLKQNLFILLQYYLLQKRAIALSRFIVCVSNNLLENIPLKYKSKAYFIPHGINTEFWNPDLVWNERAIIKQPYILSVGDHGMDEDLFEKIIKKNSNYRFVFVGIKRRFVNYSNIIYLEKITDAELRNLYFHSKSVIRPLLFSTANNSILEALAMGKAIITNEISGVIDYLDHTNSLFIEQLRDFSLSQIESKTFDSFEIRQTAIHKFSWDAILDAYKKLYFN